MSVKMNIKELDTYLTCLSKTKPGDEVEFYVDYAGCIINHESDYTRKATIIAFMRKAYYYNNKTHYLPLLGQKFYDRTPQFYYLDKYYIRDYFYNYIDNIHNYEYFYKV